MHNLLTVLSEAEYSAFYDAPIFNKKPRVEFLNLTHLELQLVHQRGGISYQVYCCLQIAYFKAVKQFYRLTWEEIPNEDLEFILATYFPHSKLVAQEISKREYYAVCHEIIKLFGYTSYSDVVTLHLAQLVRTNSSPRNIALELLSYMEEKKISRSKYSTLQRIISQAINEYEVFLENCIDKVVTNKHQLQINEILSSDAQINTLASLKQDAKNFKPRMLAQERSKLITIKPFYYLAQKLIKRAKLQPQNISYFANFIYYYNSYDLQQKIKKQKAYLYFLCYSYLRYKEINDNLTEAFKYLFTQVHDSIKAINSNNVAKLAIEEQNQLNLFKKLSMLYIDDTLTDDLFFGAIRQQAFNILSKEELIKQINGSNNNHSDIIFWQAVDQETHRIKYHIRPLVLALLFSSHNKQSNILDSIGLIKNIYNKSITDKAVVEDIKNHAAKNLLPYFINEENNEVINLARFEYSIYNKVFNSLKNGNLFIVDSCCYNSLDNELQALIPENLHSVQHLPSFKTNIEEQLSLLVTELSKLRKRFNKLLKSGGLSHLFYDNKTDTLHWKKLKVSDSNIKQQKFYAQLHSNDINSILHHVHSSCGYLDQFTHIQAKYDKNSFNISHILATIIAQAMNTGNYQMAQLTEIPYAALQDTLQSRIRLATLKAANDCLSNSIAKMSIFAYYSFDFNLIYGAVDGQKFIAKTPTLKSRFGKKYFGKVRGVVAYTLLANHIPLQVELIGANNHESHFLFDIWFNNSTTINPEIITGDMHSINKANFALMYFFGAKLHPRFSNIQIQRSNLFAGDKTIDYDNYIIKPAGFIDLELIKNNWNELQRIIITLANKQINQSNLIQKLCTYKQDSPVRLALFKFDKLIRSIYTLNYLLNPEIAKNVTKSQNRIEAYHQLRSVISQAYGNKHLIGKTNIAQEICNQCARLLANVIIYYNSLILSKLYDKYRGQNNHKALENLKKISPVAWQHINFIGKLDFSNACNIDVDEIINSIAA